MHAVAEVASAAHLRAVQQRNEITTELVLYCITRTRKQIANVESVQLWKAAGGS